MSITRPEFIRLTIGQVINLENMRPGKPATMSIIQPPIAKLFPLPMQFTREQNAAEGRARVELEMGPIVMRCMETFDDVEAALEAAYLSGAPIVRPRLVDWAAVDAAVGRTMLGEAMGEEAAEKALQDAKAAGAIRWDEAMPKVADTKPKQQPGDLRIIEVPGHGWQVEICVAVETDGQASGLGWEFGEGSSVPPEIRRVYASRETARLAVRTAGYGRRLIDG